jgi:hypothetical protein
MGIRNKYSYPTSNVKKTIFSVNDFKGVDYTPYHLKVSPQNAVDILNFLRRNGVTQKRYGTEEVVVANPQAYYVKNEDGTYTERTNPTQINGVWTFVAEDNEEHTIAHIGNLLWEVVGLEQGALKIDFFPLLKTVYDENEHKEYQLGTELQNRKSEAFVGNKRLYILGGNDMFVLRYYSKNLYEITSMRDSKEIYIPTTTIGITYKDSIVSSRSALDDTNMLTQWRKNKLVSGTYYDDGVSVRTTRFYDYELDRSINPKEENDLNELTVTVETINSEVIERE